MPDFERQLSQVEADRLVRERLGRNKHRNGIPNENAPKRRDWEWDWTLVAIIVVGVLVIGGFVALIVVRGLQRLG